MRTLTILALTVCFSAPAFAQRGAEVRNEEAPQEVRAGEVAAEDEEGEEGEEASAREEECCSGNNNVDLPELLGEILTVGHSEDTAEE